MSLESLTFGQLIGAVVVILLLIGAYNTVMSAVKTAREEKKIKNAPFAQLNKRLDDHEEHLKKDHERISALENDSNANKVENKIMMRMQLALIRHSIDGNNIEGLKEMREEVQEYLINKN